MLNMPNNIKDFRFPPGERIDPEHMSELLCPNDNRIGCAARWVDHAEQHRIISTFITGIVVLGIRWSQRSEW